MNFKRSKQRDKILEILKETDIHPTADWIYEKIKPEFPNLSFGTVYRNLNILMEQNLIQKIPFGSTHDRYEAKIDPHYHLVCEQCGLVQDFEIPVYKRLNKQAEDNSDFQITRHRIDFFGICRPCRKKSGKSTKQGDV